MAIIIQYYYNQKETPFRGFSNLFYCQNDKRPRILHQKWRFHLTFTRIKRCERFARTRYIPALNPDARSVFCKALLPSAFHSEGVTFAKPRCFPFKSNTSYVSFTSLNCSATTLEAIPVVCPGFESGAFLHQSLT